MKNIFVGYTYSTKNGNQIEIYNASDVTRKVAVKQNENGEIKFPDHYPDILKEHEEVITLNLKDFIDHSRPFHEIGFGYGTTGPEDLLSLEEWEYEMIFPSSKLI